MQLEHLPVKVEYEDSFEESCDYEIEQESFTDDSARQLENCDHDVVHGMKVEENVDVKRNERKRTIPIQFNPPPLPVCTSKKIFRDESLHVSNEKLSDSSVGDGCDEQIG